MRNLRGLSCFRNELTNIKELYCQNNHIISLPNSLANLKIFCYIYNHLASDKKSYWRIICKIQRRHQYILRKNGLERVLNTLKKRTYLPRLNNLHQELIWSLLIIQGNFSCHFLEKQNGLSIKMVLFFKK